MLKYSNNLTDFEDLRKDVGFHFTPKQNLENISQEGIIPKFGPNSGGSLGQSSIPKPYVALGLEGALQLYNRLLNLSVQAPLKSLQNPEHISFLPKSAQEKDPSSRLTILEGFEFVRQYMENNAYLIFDSKTSKYEHPLSDMELLELNSEISSLNDENGRNISKRIDFLDSKIRRLYEDTTADNTEQISVYKQERTKLSIEVWKKTLEKVQQKQGHLLNETETLLIDKIDFDDEKLLWINFEKHPHNTHTRMIEKNGIISGIPILPQTLHLFSLDGTTPANGIQFFQEISKQIRDTDSTNIEITNCVDPNILEQFSEYLTLVKQYKQSGLLIERPVQTVTTEKGAITYDSSLVVDLSNISKYPGLAEFGDRAQSLRDEKKVESEKIRQRLESEKKRKSF